MHSSFDLLDQLLHRTRHLGRLYCLVAHHHLCGPRIGLYLFWVAGPSRLVAHRAVKNLDLDPILSLLLVPLLRARRLLVYLCRSICLPVLALCSLGWSSRNLHHRRDGMVLNRDGLESASAVCPDFLLYRHVDHHAPESCQIISSKCALVNLQGSLLKNHGDQNL